MTSLSFCNGRLLSTVSKKEFNVAAFSQGGLFLDLFFLGEFDFPLDSQL